MRKIMLFLAFGLGFLVAKPIVSVSILPTKFFVQKIAGDTLEVNVMVKQGADPHTYEPKPNDMKNLAKSELFFAVGIEYENTWLPKFQKSFPNLKIIKTQEGIELMEMEEHHHHDGEDIHCQHEHGLDPHIWLDPILVKEQARNIYKALASNFAQNSEIYRQNLAKFEKELDELDEFIKTSLKDLKDRSFIVYHPSWGYFAKRYDLEQISIEIEGKEPKPAELARLIKRAKQEGSSVIFVQPQFSKKAANQIAKEINAKVVEIDQLEYDFENGLKNIVKIFTSL